MDSLDATLVRLQEAERAYERRAGEATILLEERQRVIEEIVQLEARHESLEQAIAILNSYADERQAELQQKIEVLVTHGLQTIFGPDLSFRVLQKTHGKLATAEFVVRSKVGDDEIDTPVMDARGGGVAAVIGFLLRLVVLLLQDPPVRRILFLDETFAQLSVDYEPALAEFIRELCERTGVQIIMVTHSTAFDDAADTSYRFELRDGITHVEAVQ